MSTNDAVKKLLPIVLLLSITALIWSSPAAADTATARFDRTDIYQDESVNLLIELEGRATAKTPDLSVLKKDFEVQSQSTNSRTQITNGKMTSTIQWTISLYPRRAGSITVSPIKVGSEITNPVSLNVKERVAKKSAGVKTEPIFVEVTVEPEQPYVQAQIRLVVSFFYSIPNLRGTLGDPQATNALIERLGEDATYTATRRSKNYNVVERRYAVFPQQSGNLTVAPVQFQGVVGGRQRVNTQSEPINIAVKPRPADHTGEHWLPAEQLTLSESWPGQMQEFRVGEPITRALTLQATGLLPSQIPEITIPEPQGAKIYNDQSTMNQQADNTWVYAQREQRAAIVPTLPGELKLPDIELKWWDTKNNREQIAKLAGRTITVLPAANPIGAAQTPKAATAAVNQGGNTTLTVGTNQASGNALIWKSVSAALLATWIVTIGLWWNQSRSKPQPLIEKPESPDLRLARRELKQACAENNPSSSASALLKWASLNWPESPPVSLGELALRVSDNASSVIQELDRALYSVRSNEWNGEQLWNAFKQGLEKTTSKNRAGSISADPLPSLYPKQV